MQQEREEQEREEAPWPLWVRIVCRLVSGVVVGGVMWAFGDLAGGATAIVGGAIGLTLGLAYGERAIGALIGAFFECPP